MQLEIKKIVEGNYKIVQYNGHETLFVHKELHGTLTLCGITESSVTKYWSANSTYHLFAGSMDMNTSKKQPGTSW